MLCCVIRLVELWKEIFGVKTFTIQQGLKKLQEAFTGYDPKPDTGYFYCSLLCSPYCTWTSAAPTQRCRAARPLRSNTSGPGRNRSPSFSPRSHPLEAYAAPACLPVAAGSPWNTWKKERKLILRSTSFSVLTVNECWCETWWECWALHSSSACHSSPGSAGSAVWCWSPSAHHHSAPQVVPDGW